MSQWEHVYFGEICIWEVATNKQTRPQEVRRGFTCPITQIAKRTKKLGFCPLRIKAISK